MWRSLFWWSSGGEGTAAVCLLENGRMGSGRSSINNVFRSFVTQSKKGYNSWRKKMRLRAPFIFRMEEVIAGLCAIVKGAIVFFHKEKMLMI